MDKFDLHLDYYSLHKALLEAKFHENPENELVAGGPLITDIYTGQETADKKRYGQPMGRMVSVKNRSDRRTCALLLALSFIIPFSVTRINPD